MVRSFSIKIKKREGKHDAQMLQQLKNCKLYFFLLFPFRTFKQILDLTFLTGSNFFFLFPKFPVEENRPLLHVVYFTQQTTAVLKAVHNKPCQE